jgi:hypothetical protein
MWRVSKILRVPFLEKILANKNKKALVALSLATRFVGVVSAY